MHAGWRQARGRHQAGGRLQAPSSSSGVWSARLRGRPMVSAWQLPLLTQGFPAPPSTLSTALLPMAHPPPAGRPGGPISNTQGRNRMDLLGQVSPARANQLCPGWVCPCSLHPNLGRGSAELGFSKPGEGVTDEDMDLE